MAAYDFLVKFTENKPDFSEVISFMKSISGLDVNYQKYTFSLESEDVVPYEHSSLKVIQYNIFVDSKLDQLSMFTSYDEGYSIGYVPQMFKQHYLVGVSAAALKALGANLPFPLNENIIEKRWDEIRWKFRYY